MGSSWAARAKCVSAIGRSSRNNATSPRPASASPEPGLTASARSKNVWALLWSAAREPPGPASAERRCRADRARAVVRRAAAASRGPAELVIEDGHVEQGGAICRISLRRPAETPPAPSPARPFSGGDCRAHCRPRECRRRSRGPLRIFAKAASRRSAFRSAPASLIRLTRWILSFGSTARARPIGRHSAADVAERAQGVRASGVSMLTDADGAPRRSALARATSASSTRLKRSTWSPCVAGEIVLLGRVGPHVVELRTRRIDEVERLGAKRLQLTPAVFVPWVVRLAVGLDAGIGGCA